jgi:hypothetical protein
MFTLARQQRARKPLMFLSLRRARALAGQLAHTHGDYQLSSFHIIRSHFISFLIIRQNSMPIGIHLIDLRSKRPIRRPLSRFSEKP